MRKEGSLFTTPVLVMTRMPAFIAYYRSGASMSANSRSALATASAEDIPMRPNVCDCCGGKFGMVSRNLGRKRFCSRLCRRAYLFDKWRSAHFLDALSQLSARAIGKIKSMIQHRRCASHLESAGS